ncbi:glycosyltransferase family 2 protein [Vibrio spartinae]|uniref:Putative glycosyltransferase EpsE n=1 Tax=Vibrio spartinae TaxID=1918945 RepID=A0A1N6M2S6_9VIBR|nr:glycosyltransferase family 2 protein [Vibrio spartinae]SIO93715.1 Putative glycosyltransferase EpsE [Vibrio spartinae]
MIEQNPLISVIMSVYNGEKFLRETIDSILTQSLSDFEFIIINDCSTDNTLEILEEYENIDDRIVILNNDTNLKLPASLNKGILRAKGKYIARMDADDIALPERFKIQSELLENHHEYDFIGSLVDCFYDGIIDDAYAEKEYMEKVHFNYISDSGNLAETEYKIRKGTYKTTRLCHSSLFGRTQAFRELLYTEDVFAEDWDLYNRALNRGFKITKVPEVLIKYRIVNSGMCGEFNSLPYPEIKKKIKKLNEGILKDCVKTKSYSIMIKFIWYHFVRRSLYTYTSRVLGIMKSLIKKSVFTVMKKVYKSLSNAQLIKLYHILNKSNNYLKRIPILNRVVSLTLQVLNNNDDVNPQIKEPIFKHKVFNIGIWTIEKKWMMGGLNTILKIIPVLIDNGHDVRIINYGIHSDELKSEFIDLLLSLDGFSESFRDKINIVSAATYRHRCLEFNPDDIFISGFWESAEDFIKFRQLKHFNSDTFVYIIQDYEPSMLFRWGSEYIRARNTLEDSNYYPIFNNSEFVSGYLKELGIIKGWLPNQILRGEPCETNPLSPENMSSGPIKIVFYSRPTVDKNIYSIKIEALKLLIDTIKEKDEKKFNEMEIIGIGEEAPDVEHNGFLIKNIGKVDYKDYPVFLQKFNVGLSCIISPAFAYPCIEFPRAGIVTVVNRFANRDLERYSRNIISCENSAQSIFESLQLAIERIDDKKTRYESADFSLPGVDIETATVAMLDAIVQVKYNA